MLNLIWSRGGPGTGAVVLDRRDTGRCCSIGRARASSGRARRARQQFYEKHGGKALVIARFMPIMRTFVPIVAGIGRMSYPRYAYYTVIGAASWVLSMTMLGFFVGHDAARQAHRARDHRRRSALAHARRDRVAPRAPSGASIVTAGRAESAFELRRRDAAVLQAQHARAERCREARDRA